MKTKAPKIESSIIYQGPSLIDGSPIVCIAIKSSKNRKTGSMIQTHILRADINPMEASKTGLDKAICGDCMHRGTPTADPLRKLAVGRTCYVNLAQGPLVVFKAFQRGKYPQASKEQTRAIGRGRMVRLGTYGDPAAVPASVWEALLMDSIGHTGYTHQALNMPVDHANLMVSADNAQQANEAHAKGYRTFRVIPLSTWNAEGKNSLLKNEILCPASKQAGAKVQCIECKLCVGSSIKAKSIAIPAHGIGANSLKA